MSLIPLKQTITHEAKTERRNRNGSPAFAAPVTRKARVVEQAKAIRNRDGEEVQSTVTIYLDRLAPVSVDDRLTYTDELGRGRTYTAIHYEVKRDVGAKPLLTVVYAT